MGLLNYLMNTLRCPHCASKDVEIASGGNGYSGFLGGIGKAMYGPSGLVLGVGGRKNKDTCHCRKCGYVWHQRL